MNKKLKIISAVLMLVVSAVGCSSDDSSTYVSTNTNDTSSTVVSTYVPIVNYQTVSIEEYQEEIIEMDEDELITVEFIENSNIYEGQKYILIQRLEMGEAITFGDLVAENIFEEISVDQINLMSEIEKQFKIIAEPNSIVTITSSSEDLFTINIIEEIVENEEDAEIGESSSLNEDGEEVTDEDEEIAEPEEVTDEVEEITEPEEVTDEDEEIAEPEEVTDEVEEIAELEEVTDEDEEIAEPEEVTDEVEEIAELEEVTDEVEEIAELEEVTDEVEEIAEPEEVTDEVEEIAELEEVTDEVEEIAELEEVTDEVEEIAELEEVTDEDEEIAESEEVTDEVEEETAEPEEVTDEDEEEITEPEEVVDEVEEEIAETEEVESYLAEDVRYEIVPVGNGEGTIEVTITNANYETVYLTIPVTVTAPQTVVYVATESVEVENEVTETYSYIVYPENAQISIESTDEEIVTTLVEDNTISITGNGIGEADLVITCESNNFESTNTTITTNIIPTKTTFELEQNIIEVGCLAPANVGFTKNENSELNFDYSADELELEYDGCCFTVTPLVEGELYLTITATEEDYYDNEVEVTIISTTEQLELEVSETMVNIGADEVAEIGLYVGAEEFEVEIIPTEGVTAEVVDNVIEITATQDGTITITATKEGFSENTRTIDVWFEKEAIEFGIMDLIVTVVGDEVATSTLETTIEECDIIISTTEGVTAEYDAETGEITITATENGVVTVTAQKEGYAPAKHYIAVTFEAGEEIVSDEEADEEVVEVSLLLDSTDTIISSLDDELAINVFATDDAEISLSSTSGINVDYIDNQLIITADNSGTITVTATKEGYAMTTSKIVVNYMPDGEVVDLVDLIEDVEIEIEEVVEVDFATEVINLVNEARLSEGLSELILNDNLSQTANFRAEEIVEVFSHTRADGSSWSTCLTDYDFTNIGENIANGQTSPENVMRAWLNSEGHKANILNEKFTEIGVGVYENNGRYYWVQIFGNQK